VSAVARLAVPSPSARRHTGAEGVAARHSRNCEWRSGGRCSCTPTFQAQVWSPQDKKTIRKTFPTIVAARAWRQETQVGIRKRLLRAPSAIRLEQAAQEWLEAAKAGIIRTRSGDPYKPSALRSYEQVLRTLLLPRFGQRTLSSLSRNEIQDFVDLLVARGLAASTVRNAILPLRAIYRRTLSRGELAVNPTLKLELPRVRSRRERVARPDEAATLIRALNAEGRALWATALYAGLRCGELQALRWNDLDFEARLIRVEHSWDRVVGLIEPKSRSGKRRLPMTETLRKELLSHRLRQRGSDKGHVFRGRRGRPFDPSMTAKRARDAWRAAGLEPIGLHECRHSYAAFMIAAGVNAKALSTYMGHSTITVTLDRYGHLLPGNEQEAADLLESWLACSRVAVASLSDP
jgi:integrase